MKIITLIFLVSLISACGSKKIYFKHHQYGKVQTKSDVYTSERTKCDLDVFGDGIVLSDRVLKNRSDAYSYMAEHAMSSVGPREKKEEINLVFKKSSQCMRDKGWERVE
jgi:hypothetical protein